MVCRQESLSDEELDEPLELDEEDELLELELDRARK
jgi:hypothetical protein